MDSLQTNGTQPEPHGADGAIDDGALDDEAGGDTSDDAVRAEATDSESGGEVSADAARDRDRELIRRWQGGDHESGLELIQNYHSYFHSLCWSQGVISEEERLDLYQEVVARLLKVLPGLELRSSFAGYLRRVFITARRESRRHTSALPLQEELAGAAPTGSDPATGAEILGAVGKCRDQLDARERRAFDGRIFEDRSFRELALEMKVALGNLHVIYHRARAKMRTCLEQKGFALDD